MNSVDRTLGLNIFGDDDLDQQFSFARLHSRYWMDNLPENDIDIISLASYRRAVAKFVRISTLSSGIDKEIIVKFNVQDTSYTTGNKVVLSAQIKNSEFDAVVGLALHESNHIIYTNFASFGEILNLAYDILNKELVEQSLRLDINTYYVREVVREYANWIEDKRVDRLGWEKSPGYKPYYKALYNKYYNSNNVSIGLRSNHLRDINLRSYKFRVINIFNKFSDLDALPGLKEIYDLIDIDNISRLKSTADSIKLGMDVLNIIYSYLPTPESKTEQLSKDDSNQDNKDQNQTDNTPENNESQELPDDMVNEEIPEPGNEPAEDKSGDGEEDSDNSESGEGEEDSDDSESGEGKENSDNSESDEGKEDSDDIDSDDIESDDSEEDSDKNNKNKSDEDETEEPKKLPELSKNQEKNLKKELENQEDFLNGEVKKRSLNKKDERLVDAIEESNTTMERVQGNNKTGMEVMVVQKLNKQILKTLPIGKLSTYSESVKALSEGIRIGKQLAHKLQIRNDVKVIKSKRKTSGKIDKRLLYGVGFGDTSIFEQNKVDQFGDALVHISIDASGSMRGNRWLSTMTSVIAIAYAASQVSNLDIIISFRSTMDIRRGRIRKRGYTSTDTPLMVMAYDSRVDSFKKIQTIFPYLQPAGLTPEGLCYEAILKDILSSVAGKIGYFINFSDGGPNMINEDNSNALKTPEEIARVMVNKMRNVGIRILSFYISEYNEESESFTTMYGKDGKVIDVTKIIPLARELNKLFSTQKN